MARTGSKVLELILHLALVHNVNPDSVRLLEFFRTGINSQQLKYLKYNYVNKGIPFSLKLMSMQSDQTILDYFIRKGYHFVCLYREDLMAQLTSYLLARHFDGWWSDVHKLRIKNGSVPVDEAGLEKFVFTHHQLFHDALVDMPNKTMIRYEDFADDLNNVFEILPDWKIEGVDLNEMVNIKKVRQYGPPLNYFDAPEKLEATVAQLTKLYRRTK